MLSLGGFSVFQTDGNTPRGTSWRTEQTYVEEPLLVGSTPTSYLHHFRVTIAVRVFGHRLVEKALEPQRRQARDTHQ